MKIAIIIPSLNTGGAERTAVSLANWISTNTDSQVLLINLGKNDGTYKINDNVKVIHRKNSRIKNFFDVLKKLKNEKVDIIFEMLYTPIRLALPYKIIYNRKVIIVGSERCNPSMHKKIRNKIRSRIIPKLCDGYIFQTKIVQSMFNNRIIKKSTVIHNAISNPDAYTTKRSKTPQKVISSIGRLTYAKGYDDLIKSFAKVATKHPEYILKIYGNGEKKEELQNLIKSFGLNNKIFLEGIKKDALKLVAKGDIFIMTSRYEGMPNALLEAMAIGMPCISTNCIAGPSEIITNNTNGILVNVGDIEEISRKISELIENKELKEKISNNASKILTTHSQDIIFNKYYNYFKKLYRGR